MSNTAENGIGKGYVQVYTGNGKGKTTAALGLAFRAAGAGMKVYIAQFAKGTQYSELQSVGLLPLGMIELEQFGVGSFIAKNGVMSDTDKQRAECCLARVKEQIFSRKYQIIICDEINIAVYHELIDVSDVINLIDSKPDGVELILTGRYAKDEVINRADLVSEIIEVKHYLKSGVPARIGIEK